MSLVFQNIDPRPPPPLRPASVYPPPLLGGRTHLPGGEGGRGSIFWKTRDIGLTSYSNNLSTGVCLHGPHRQLCIHYTCRCFFFQRLMIPNIMKKRLD
jgi:hypothetical protein